MPNNFIWKVSFFLNQNTRILLFRLEYKAQKMDIIKYYLQTFYICVYLFCTATYLHFYLQSFNAVKFDFYKKVLEVYLFMENTVNLQHF